MQVATANRGDVSFVGLADVYKLVCHVLCWCLLCVAVGTPAVPPCVTDPRLHLCISARQMAATCRQQAAEAALTLHVQQRECVHINTRPKYTQKHEMLL